MFVMLAFYLIANDSADRHGGFALTFTKVIAVANIALFGLNGVLGIRKMFDTFPGVIIDENGIFNNSVAGSIGRYVERIKWSDITEIKTRGILLSRFISIYVTKPDDYINRARGFEKMFMKLNHKMYGTPIFIVSATLKCDFTELEMTLYDKFNEHKI